MKRVICVFFVAVSLLSLGMACNPKTEQNGENIQSPDRIKSDAPSQIPINTSAPKSASISKKREIVSAASWPKAYDFQELVNSSVLIVEGTVGQQVQTRNLGTDQSPIIFTDFQIDISKVLEDYPGFDLDSILVMQQGGAFKDIIYSVEGNAPFQIGQRVLLFLNDPSDDPIHTVKGETKFAVMMPTGQFTIADDGTIDVPYKDSLVAEKYQGKNIAQLEQDISSALPDSSYYARDFANSSLIVEGKVGEPHSRLVEAEDTHSVYTVYPFEVGDILYDDLQHTKSFVSRTKWYEHAPINIGDTISVFERGGTYKDITQRWAWSWEMKPGTRVFVGANARKDFYFTIAAHKLIGKRLQACM